MAEADSMSLSPEQRDRVLKTVQERVGGEIRCSLCGSSTWMFTEGITVIQAQDSLGMTAVPDRGLPSLPLVCRQCGNTYFLNVIALGLSDLFSEDGKVSRERRTA
jgi:hypothetical protein